LDCSGGASENLVITAVYWLVLYLQYPQGECVLVFPIWVHTHIYNTKKCTTLLDEPDRVHAQNMEQLHAFDCHQNVAEPQATENHIKHVHRNCESGLVIIYKHAAHRLVQHRLQVVEMAWTNDSTLVIFFYLRYR